MKLKQYIKKISPIMEDAAGGAVGAGSVAACPMPLMSQMIKRSIPSKPQLIKFGSSPYKKSKKFNKKLGLGEIFHMLESFGPDKAEDDFDISGVISKLKSLEDKESVDYRDTVTFGLVDTKGEIIRVTIPRDQASGFEQDIQAFMSQYDESKPTPEIAEILFKMKNSYNIINVEWGDAEEDAEESETQLDQPEGEGSELEGGEEPLAGDQNANEPLPDMGTPPTEPTVDTTQAADLLSQVIDLLRADIDTRKQEAIARSAEAQTRQSASARDHAMARVKQEEQFLDMDEYQKSQKSREKEAKRLAQLAKWKHDVHSGKTEENPNMEPQYDFLPGDENEEYSNIGKNSYREQPRYREEEERSYKTPIRQQPQDDRKKLSGKVHPSDIAKFIMNRVK